MNGIPKPEDGSELPRIDREPPVVDEIIHALRSHGEFLIIGHLRPDGDCLGSCLALFDVLERMRKKVRFYTVGPLQDMFSFLPHYDRIITGELKQHEPVCIFVDSGDPDRAGDDFRPSGLVINIDHHLSNSMYGQLNWVDVDATAAGELIYRLLRAMNEPITREVATCLYTAIMTDTGGFRFSNTDEMTFRVASALVECGADPARIAGYVYESRKPESVRLTGEVYATLKYEFDGQFVWNELRRELFDRIGGEEFEPEGLSSDVRGIAGVEVAVLFYETPEHFCRIGFRSKGKVNVSKLAQSLGGGGHHNASGAFIKEPFDQARDRVLNAIREYLREAL